MFYLAPYFIFVGYIVVQFNHYTAKSVLTCAYCLSPVHFLKREQVSFKGFYQLRLYFLACGSRIYPDNNACAQSEIRKFRFRHLVKPVNAQKHHQADNQKGYAVVVHQPRHPPCIFLIFHNALTLLPSLNFCIPRIITESFSLMPEIISILEPYVLPVATVRL